MRLCFLLPLLLLAGARADIPAYPSWAEPGSATHKQVPPPAGFHRETRTTSDPIGQFEAQSDIGGALVPGSSAFDAATGRYSIRSAGYNIWYTRDEFRYLWKKMSGDATIAATIAFQNVKGYFDRKAVLVVRESLTDDAKEAMVALHGGGLIHLASRPAAGADLKETCRLKAAPPTAAGIRLALRKRGEAFTLLVSLNGEELHEVGSPLHLAFDSPFYIGIGFTSHQPVTVDAAELSDVRIDP